MNTGLKCSCNGNLHLELLPKNIQKQSKNYIFIDCPQLVCSNCKKKYWAYGIKKICEEVISKYCDDKVSKTTLYFDFNKIKNKFYVDKFISTKVTFLYDRDDYYFLPGLAREWDKGYLTPVYFNIEVLLKYIHHPKYSVDLGADTYGQIYKNNVHMISFGINENNKIIMWLGDIGDLPVEEQFYLRSENVISDHSISSEFYEGQIEVIWAEESIIKQLFRKRFNFNEKVINNYGMKITQLDTETVELAKNIHRPIVNTDEEFSSIMIAMNKLFVESIAAAEIKKFMKQNYPKIDLKNKKGIKLYQEWLNISTKNVNINAAICPLYVLYDLRIAMAHLQSNDTKEGMISSCCKRLGLNECERDYIKIFDVLINKLNEMYDSYSNNLKILVDGEGENDEK